MLLCACFHSQLGIDKNAAAAEGKSAFAIETEAYTASSSREEYENACDILRNASKPASNDENDSPSFTPAARHGSEMAESGVRIGTHQNCQYIASGVTAEVYRCDTRAFKVIVETHNIAPHDPVRESRILAELSRPCIPLLETFRDHEQRLVLVFPYMPLSLEEQLQQKGEAGLTPERIRSHFRDVFTALRQIHGKSIIHRDMKPSAILLKSPDGPAYLADFGTAWHPQLSCATEPQDAKILDIGTGPYRAPEVLFGDKGYGTAVDMWGAGAMLVECCRPSHVPLFESRAAHEDGNQLGLILNTAISDVPDDTRENMG
ncbi:cell division protein kinase 7 [Pyricularia oryzae Y34]|uniref:cyclin-dependent kinase n=2 Tax=Pyricularia oryzae TaxID=318829 RepID=A0AA97NR64_PYRO3|nr:cell division protein kinase 7 [Pyricularia oryzae Y34]